MRAIRALPLFLLLLVILNAEAAPAAEIAVSNGEELAVVLGGGAWEGRVLDDGDVVVLDGEDEVFVMAEQPEPYYKGFDFTVRTAASRPADKRQVTIRYIGPDKAEIFTMTAGKVQLSNIMLEGWSLEPCCPVY